MTAQIESLEFHGIEAFRLQTPNGANAIVSRQGAQVLSWIAADGQEQLYLSERAIYDGSAAIRGGIPVCFPQFSNLGKLPKHGLLRTRLWNVGAQRCREDYALLSLQIEPDAEMLALWPHAFRAELTVALNPAGLEVELEIENTGSSSFNFTSALHSYLRVSKIHKVELRGLTGLLYRDAAHGDKIQPETAPHLCIEEEVDRVYHRASKPLMLSDGPRTLTIQNQGFPDVVVWNPWRTLGARLSDMAPDDYHHMLCVEAAAARQPITLAQEEIWAGRQSFALV